MNTYDHILLEIWGTFLLGIFISGVLSAATLVLTLIILYWKDMRE